MSEDLLPLMLNLLEKNIFKTTSQLVQEFRAEYPQQWKQLEEEGRSLYGEGCQAKQNPETRLRQVLFAIPKDKCLYYRKGDEYYWSTP